MQYMRNTYACSLAAVAGLLGLLTMPVATGTQTAPGFERMQTVEAEFRGCESAGWCRFRIEAPDAHAQSLVRLWPDGVTRVAAGDPAAPALRNRLNALLSNMIHQAKHIVLHDLRRLDDGTLAALVTINGADLAADPLVVELGRRADTSHR